MQWQQYSSKGTEVGNVWIRFSARQPGWQEINALGYGRDSLLHLCLKIDQSHYFNCFHHLGIVMFQFRPTYFTVWTHTTIILFSALLNFDTIIIITDFSNVKDTCFLVSRIYQIKFMGERFIILLSIHVGKFSWIYF